MIDTGWLLSVTIPGGIAVIAVITATAAGTRFLTAHRRRQAGAAFGTFVTGFLVFLVAGLITLFTSLPWSMQYHEYRREAGTVKAVGNRFLANSSGGTTQKFVVTFADGSSFGCLDTRCAQVRPGDKLTLWCERAFQFNAPAEGWDCNWGRDVKPGGQVIP